MRFLLINISSLSVILIGFLLLIFRNSNINRILGFYSDLSIKNHNTWKVGNTICGKMCIFTGGISLILSLIPHTILLYNWKTTIMIILIINVLLLIVVRLHVNHKLAIIFDEFGNLRA